MDDLDFLEWLLPVLFVVGAIVKALYNNRGQWKNLPDSTGKTMKDIKDVFAEIKQYQETHSQPNYESFKPVETPPVIKKTYSGEKPNYVEENAEFEESYEKLPDLADLPDKSTADVLREKEEYKLASKYKDYEAQLAKINALKDSVHNNFDASAIYAQDITKEENDIVHNVDYAQFIRDNGKIALVLSEIILPANSKLKNKS